MIQCAVADSCLASLPKGSRLGRRSNGQTPDARNLNTYLSSFDGIGGECLGVLVVVLAAYGPDGVAGLRFRLICLMALCCLREAALLAASLQIATPYAKKLLYSPLGAAEACSRGVQIANGSPCMARGEAPASPSSGSSISGQIWT